MNWILPGALLLLTSSLVPVGKAAPSQFANPEFHFRIDFGPLRPTVTRVGVAGKPGSAIQYLTPKAADLAIGLRVEQAAPVGTDLTRVPGILARGQKFCSHTSKPDRTETARISAGLGIDVFSEMPGRWKSAERILVWQDKIYCLAVGYSVAGPAAQANESRALATLHSLDIVP